MDIDGHRKKAVEGHKRSWKVLKGHGKSFPDTRFAFQWWPVGLECQAKYQSLTSFFGLGVGTWDLDLGLTKNLFFVSGVRHFYHYKYQVFLDKIIFLPELWEQSMCLVTTIIMVTRDKAEVLLSK